MIIKKWNELVLNHLKRKSNINKNNLTKKNLYIFPNFKGFQLGAFIFFSFAASIFYQNNVGLLICIIFFSVFFISIIISYQNLSDIRIESLTNLVPCNKKIYLDFLVKNLSRREKLNINLKFNGKEKINLDLTREKKIEIENFFIKRGKKQIPHIEVNSLFPFGIIKSFGIINFKEYIYIYPEPIKPDLQILNKFKIQNKINDDDYEFDSIEEAKQGESLSKISWKHYSIKKKLFVKKFNHINKKNTVLIDIDRLNENGLEKALSNAVFLIEYYYNLKIKFALKYKDFISEYSNSLTHKNNLLKFTANV